MWHLYVPKLVTVLRRGYGVDDFRRDLVSGLTVAVAALALAMALAIASGTTPEKVLCGLPEQPRQILTQMGLRPD